MSRLHILTAGFLFLLTATPALSADVKLGDLGFQGGANGNPHNLSSLADPTPQAPRVTPRPKATDTTEICVFCHTPHSATPQSTLWNRLAPERMGSFPLFNSAYALDPSGLFAIDDTDIAGVTEYKLDDNDPATAFEYPNGATKLCLSCHDGATALGVLADGRVVTMTQDTITEPTMFWDPVSGTGMDFSKSHPVSFVYNDTVVNYINNNTTKADVYKLPATTSRIKLDGQKRMQCTTCHEPHFDSRSAGHTYPFWRNAGVVPSGTDEDDYDATCAECHTPRRTFTPHDI